MKKKFALCLVFMFACLGFVMTGCQQTSIGTEIKSSTDVVSIRLGEENEEGSELSTVNFVVTVDKFENSNIVFRVENEGIIMVDSKREYDHYDVTVKGLRAGQAKVVAFLAENSKISKEITVNVIQPIKDLTLQQGFEHYVAIGQRNAIRPNESLVITPIDGDVNEIKYSILENNAGLNISIDENTGVIDAREVSSAGSIVVRATAGENVYADIPVNVIKAVGAEDVTITREYLTDNDSLILYQQGELIYDNLTMVKTIEYYSEFVLDFTYDASVLGQNVTATVVEGNSITVNKLSEERVIVKAVGLGKNKLKLSFSINGAEDFIEATEIELSINVIESPYDINVNGESSKANNGEFDYTIYNRYASGDYGMAFRFTLSPSSVLEENADIEIKFDEPLEVQESLLILDSEGNRLGAILNSSGKVVGFEDFRIKAGETIYIKSTLSTVLSGTNYSFTATSLVSKSFEKGEEISTRVNLNVLEGISALTTTQDKFYVEKGEGNEYGAYVSLGTGNNVGDTSGITFSVSDSTKVRVVKNSNTDYVIYGLENGESTVTFDSGNGHTLTITVIVYGKLDSAIILSENQFENGSIGEKVLDGQQSLSYISARVKGGFSTSVKTNEGASVAYVKYEVNAQGQNYVSVSNSNGYVSILGVGTAIVTVYIFGYNEYGVVEEDEALTKTFTVEGYIPVTSIGINYTYVALKDYTTVGYNNISKYSQVNLNLSVFPNNASIDTDDIVWEVIGSSGSITQTNGLSTLFTAGPITQMDRDNETVTVVAYVKDKGRTYSATCQIDVAKALMVEDIKFVNVFNSEVYFDARDGLATYDENNNIIATENSFKVIANAYPDNAFNKNIRYIYVQNSQDTNATPVFTVSSDGKIMPIRGGIATLRVVAEDSYVDLNNVSMYRDIKVIVADGSSIETAYRITDANDLIDVGQNKNSMNLHYVLANDIDLSKISNWQPIGSATLPFTGYLSGKYTVGYNNLEITSKITGLNIDTVVTGNEDAYIGLFANINLGQIVDLEVECSKFVIDASNLSGNLYAGIMAGVVQRVVDDTIDTSLNVNKTKIENSGVEGITNNRDYYKVATSTTNSYIGGMFGYVYSGVDIKLSSNLTAVNLTYLNVVDESANASNSIYVGGLAGAIQTELRINANNEVFSVSNSSITGGFSLNGNVVNGSNIVYQTYFKNSGLDVVVNNFNVQDATASESSVGGLVGKTIINEVVNGQNSTVDYVVNTIADVENLFAIYNVGVSANIKALSTTNVGGIVGFNNYQLRNVYFTGSVEGKSNVGGIAGQSTSLINKAVVENNKSFAVKGTNNVGGIAGQLNNLSRQYIFFNNTAMSESVNFNMSAMIAYSYISSAYESNIVEGSTSVGTIVGSSISGLVFGSYSDIKSSSSVMVGSSNGGQVDFSFIIGGSIGASYTNSYYYIDEINTDYNESVLLGATYNGSSLWIKPGSTITIKGQSITLDESINGGKVIICIPNELPIYNVIYTSLNIQVKESGDGFIRVADEKAVVFFYELSEEFESNLSSSKKYELRQIANNLNVLDLNDLLDVEVSPSPFGSVRLDVSATDANGVESNIVTVNSNGTLTIKGEGLVLLNITSVVNPSLKTTIQVYVTRYVSAFKLYSGTNASGIEYDNGEEIKIRKDYKTDIFAQILSEFNDSQFTKNEDLGLTLEMNSTSANTLVESTTSYYVVVDGEVYISESNGSGELVFNGLTGATIGYELDANNNMVVYLEYNSNKYYVYQNTYASYFDFNHFTVNENAFEATYYIEVDGVKHIATMSNNNLVFEDLDAEKLILQKTEKDGRIGYSVVYNGKYYPVYVNKIYVDIDTVSTLSLEGLNAYKNEVTVKPFFKVQFLDENSRVVSQNVYATNNQINNKNFNINIYEGAISIEGTIDSVVYSPSDTVNFEVYLISDASTDGLTVDIKGEDDYLNLTLNYVSTTQLNDGTYKILYEVSANLENSFTARYLTGNKTYNLTFISDLISDKTKTISIEFAPQQVQRLDVQNYTNGEVRLDENGELVYNRNEVASLYIASNSSGMLNINMYPFYSNVDMVTIESQEVEGEKVTFTQLAKIQYGDFTSSYTALKPRSQYTEDGNAMILQKYSSIYNEDKSFDGNFYVRTLISDNLAEGTILPIIVKAYNYDASGKLVLAKETVINLVVKEIPFVKVELEEPSTTNYVVRGTSTNLLVTMGRTFSGQTYNATVYMDNDELNASESEIEKVLYLKSNNYEVVNGREVYKDSIYVGIGVPSGTEITVFVLVEYEENGISRSVFSELRLVVIDFLIEDIDLYSFNNESNYLRMNMQEYYEIGVSNVYFKSAPTFDVAKRLYTSISADSEALYNGYFYGTIVLANGSKLYMAKSYNDYIVANATGTNLSGQRFVYDSEYNFVLKDDSSVDIYSLLPNGASFEIGLEAKMGKLESSIRYDISKFTKKIDNNTYNSIETEIGQNSKYYIKQDYQTGKAYLIGLTAGSNYQIKYSLKYGFDSDNDYQIKVYEDYELPESFMIFEQDYSFNIITYSDMDLPLPIYTQADLENMTAGEHYILMNDITLTEFVPISTQIASFDGNGYSLILRTFDLAGIASGSTIELGLFASIAEDTVIKNVSLNISDLRTLDLSNYSTINIGFFAIENDGIITNSYVGFESVSTSGSSYDQSTVINGVEIETVSTMKTLEIKTSAYVNGAETNLNLATFVYSNNADITNSRVGMDNNAYLEIKAKGNLAGFTMNNSGHISSSFVSNLYMYNTNPSATNSMTAGFVASNQGDILASYVKGGFVQEDFRSKYGALISNGNIGGFVYENSGNITDSYSNITLSSNARTGGFVFVNKDKGVIKTSYSASKIMTNSALHMPFVGVDSKSNVQNYNASGLVNCYYLALGDEAYESSSLGEGVVALNAEEFATELKFNDFSFSVTDVYDSVWTMEQGYPELVSANQIAVSSRTIERYDDGTFTYIFGVNDHLGTKNNPYLIANAEDFNFYFNQDYKESDKIIDNKYYRIISDIDFDEVAGDNMTKDVTLCNVSIDGNGYTLSNIRINSSAEDNETLSIGLFKKIYADSENGKFTTIKNLSLEIVEANALNVSYMGGLAGIIEDTNLLNINVSSSTVMQAYNVVGGLAGRISGTSVLMRINSSASVQAVYKASNRNDRPLIYDKQDDVRKISHAGTVAGIVDLETDLPYEEFELINNANMRFIKTTGNVSVSAEYAGGVFGYLGEDCHVYDVDFELSYIDEDDIQHINSTYTAGGIVGVNYGIINHAKVRHGDEEQKLIDNAMKTYLATGATGNFGKTNLFSGKLWYVGGLVGINYGGVITNSYARVDIVDPNITGDIDTVTEQYFGGLVGVTYGGEISSAYASGNVVTKASETSYAGGLIGRVNYLAGRVIKDQDNKTNPYVITIRTLYALNYWDYNLSKTTFRDDSKYTGVMIGYVSPVEDSKITTDVGQLYSIDQIRFNGNDVFAETDGNGANVFKTVAKNDADLFGNSTDLSYALDNPSDTITLNDIYEVDSNNFAHVITFLTDLLNVSGGEIWDRYWGEYPELRLGNKIDELEIYTAQQLIKEMNETPYKTFRIMNDLDFTGVNTYVTRTFTGRLLSARTNENEETISTNFYNIDYSSMFADKKENIGFFAFTKRATISNINFYIKGGDYSSVNVNRFGVVSAQDEASSFNNVRVICVSQNLTLSNVSSSTLSTLKINGVKVGGIVGDASGTIVLNACSYTGGLELNNSYTSNKDLYFGGLVGYSSIIKLYDRSTFGYFDYSSNIQFGEYVQKSATEPDYRFILIGDVNVDSLPTGNSSLVVTKVDSYTNNLYVGGLVGYNDSMLIVNNASIQNQNNSNLDINVDCSAKYIRVGGLAGTIMSGSIKNFKGFVDLSVSHGTWVYAGGLVGESTNAVISSVFVGEYDNNSSIYVEDTISIAKIGGIVGSAIVTSMNASNLINQTTAFVDIEFDGNATSLAVGGIYGEFENFAKTSATIQNNRMNAYGSITANTAQYMYVGGLVGNNVLMTSDEDEASATSINYSYSGMEIDVYTNKVAYIGGIIGNAENMSLNNLVLNSSTELNNSGSLEINNCLASGYIELSTGNNFEHIYAGGIAGDTRDAITNTTILTTIVKPEYGNANKNKYSIDILAGLNNYKGGNSGIIVVDEVTGSRFESSKLLTSDGNEVRFANSDTYLIQDYTDFVSSFNANGQTIYSYIKEIIEIERGSVFNPIRVTSASSISSTAKSYHLLTSDITISSSKTINGVFAGNYHNITANSTIFTSIGKYGVVGNFAVESSSTGNSSSLLAGTNNGVIHDIYAIGKVSGSSVGGLVTTNNGMILNAIVDIELISNGGTSGMIASTSTNGTIFNCFTLGGLVADSGNYVGTVVGSSTNTLYKFVNSVTSLDTTLTSSSAGFVGNSNNDKYVYCSFDAQALTRNSLPLSNSTLKVLEFDKYLSNSINTSSSYYMLYSTDEETNNVCRAEDKNFGYAYFPRFDSFIKQTIIDGYTYVNNFSAFYDLLDNNYKQGVKIKLAYNINQHGFDVIGQTKKAWNPKSANHFVGELDGNDKKLKGLSITTKKINYQNGKYDVLIGLFYSITSTDSFQSKITNLNLELEEATNMLQEYQRFTTYNQASAKAELAKIGVYTGTLAGVISGTSSKPVIVDGVNVSFINNQTLVGNSAGGIAGYAEYAEFKNCSTDNFTVKAFNIVITSRFNASYGRINAITTKFAFAGGVVGSTYNVTIKDCTNNATVIGDNGFDGEYFYSSTLASSSYNTNASKTESTSVCPYSVSVDYVKYVASAGTNAGGAGTNGTDASPVGGFVAYAVNSVFTNNTNNGVVTSGHAGNGTDATGYNQEDGTGYNGGDGGNAYLGGIAGVQEDCQFTGNTNSGSFAVITDGSHSTAGGHGGNGSDGQDNAKHCCYGRTNSFYCNHGNWGSGTHSCSDVTRGNNGGNGGNGGVTFVGNQYGSDRFHIIVVSSDLETSYGTVESLLCAEGGDGGNGSRGGNGSYFSLLDGYHLGKPSGKSGNGGENGNLEEYTDDTNGDGVPDGRGITNPNDVDMGGAESQGGLGGPSVPCYLQN